MNKSFFKNMKEQIKPSDKVLNELLEKINSAPRVKSKVWLNITYAAAAAVLILAVIFIPRAGSDGKIKVYESSTASDCGGNSGCKVKNPAASADSIILGHIIDDTNSLNPQSSNSSGVPSKVNTSETSGENSKTDNKKPEESKAPSDSSSVHAADSKTDTEGSSKTDNVSGAESYGSSDADQDEANKLAQCTAIDYNGVAYNYILVSSPEEIGITKLGFGTAMAENISVTADIYSDDTLPSDTLIWLKTRTSDYYAYFNSGFPKDTLSRYISSLCLKNLSCIQAMGDLTQSYSSEIKTEFDCEKNRQAVTMLEHLESIAGSAQKCDNDTAYENIYNSGSYGLYFEMSYPYSYSEQCTISISRTGYIQFRFMGQTVSYYIGVNADAVIDRLAGDFNLQ